LNKNKTSASNTSFGAYGSFFMQQDVTESSASLRIERLMILFRHRLSNQFSFYAEAGNEHAAVDGGKTAFEIAQVYLQVHCFKNHALNIGMFYPRMGLIQENRFPTFYRGTERNYVETYIIPGTWRHIGISLAGPLANTKISYTLSLVNGLSSERFEHNTLIRRGRFETLNTSANNIALQASLQYHKNKFMVQWSGYYGGSVALKSRQADSLYLESGWFGTPVMLSDISLQYKGKRLQPTLMLCGVSIPDAHALNRAYASNIARMAYGAYAELAYIVPDQITQHRFYNTVLFLRAEALDMHYQIPENGLKDESLRQQHLVAGIQIHPIEQVVFKLDTRLSRSGRPYAGLSQPATTNYWQRHQWIHLGLGFTF